MTVIVNDLLDPAGGEILLGMFPGDLPAGSVATGGRTPLDVRVQKYIDLATTRAAADGISGDLRDAAITEYAYYLAWSAHYRVAIVRAASATEEDGSYTYTPAQIGAAAATRDAHLAAYAALKPATAPSQPSSGDDASRALPTRFTF